MKNTIIYTSSRIEALAEKIASHLKENGNLFQQPLILVPNGNLRKWLKLELAERNGASAGLDIRFLETGLAAQFYDEESGEPLTDDTLALLINARLSTQCAQDDPLTPLYDYFTTGATPDPSRRWQLSLKLAGLFRDYGLHRADYMEEWISGNTAFGSLDDKITAAQAALYKEIFAKEGLLAQVNAHRQEEGEKPFISLFSPQTMEGVGENEIHIFGFSSISPWHMKLLNQLSSTVKTRFYFLAPDFPQEIAGPEILSETRKLWGRAVSGNTHLIQKIFSITPEALPGQFTAKNLLSTVQTALNEGHYPDGPTAIDESLTITGAPGIYREVETVYQSILHEMETDKSLQLTNIAVLTTGIQTYLPAILSVFEGQSSGKNRLPFNLSDTSAYEESVYGQALLTLLSTITGDLTRRDVLTLIRNPAVQAGRKISEQTVNIWAEWASGLRIFRDAEGGGKSWRFGLERLRLSRIMNADEAHPQGFEGRQPWKDLESDKGELVARFSSLIEDLIHYYRNINETPHNAVGWRRELEWLMETFLAVPLERPAEIRVRTGIERALDQLTVADTASSILKHDDQLDATVIRDFLSRKLQGIPVTRGQYLTGGVTISSLLPMRPVPFRHVYILGLQEGQFPGTSESNLLDLRSREAEPRKEDLSTPELNRALFLETLLCTREKLFLSYINRDLQKDREFFPCSTLNRLRGLLKECRSEKHPVKDAPLKGYSSRYITAGEERTTLPNYNTHDRLLCLKRLEKQERLVSKPSAKQLTRFTPASMPLQEEESEQDKEISISIRDLTGFLQNPGKTQIRRRIHSEITPREDNSMEIHPTLISGYDVRNPLLEKMIEMVFQGNHDPLPTIQQFYKNNLSHRQVTPDGPFRTLDWKLLEKDFKKILEGKNGKDGLLQFSRDIPGRYTEFSPARLSGKTIATQSDIFDIHIETLHLPDGTQVRITGDLPWVLRSPDNSHRAMLIRQFGANDATEYSTIPSTLFAVAERSLAREPCPNQEIVLVGHDKTTRQTFDIGRTNCNEYLLNLVSDYLKPTPPEALPLKGVLAFLKSNAPKIGRSKAVTPEHIKKCAATFAADFDAYLTLEGKDNGYLDSWLELSQAEVPPDAGEILLRRILPLFEIRNTRNTP